MIQYLTNTSIIWLSSLLVYEILFRKVSFHKYNRFYLLATLVAGALLPLLNINSLLPDMSIVLPEPTRRVVDVQKAIQIGEDVPTVAFASPGFDVAKLLGITYLAGASIAMMLLLREALSLARLYIRGSKLREGNNMIVETGKNHSPFSFFRIIFTRSRSEYSTAQWQLVVAHEQEHGRLLHSLDNLLLLSARVLFWFHPLVHVYYIRLRMVHEFQADKAAAANLQVYGTFLLEQTLLQRAPVLAHSLNYSPVKSRINMLAKSGSKKGQLLRYMAVIPLSLIMVVFCTKTSISGLLSNDDSKAVFKGNEIVFGEFKVIPFSYEETVKQQKALFMPVTLPDSIFVKNWSTNRYEMQAIVKDMMPVAINGKPVLGNEAHYLLADGDKQYTPPVLSSGGINLNEYLFARLQPELEKLEDGIYTLNINRMVIDQNGEVAYYENKGLEAYRNPDYNYPVIAADIKQAISRIIADNLDHAVKFKPAMKDGRPVNVRLTFANYDIVVKHHKAQLLERSGC